jgi:Flp pilus assembly pilin Flp
MTKVQPLMFHYRSSPKHEKSTVVGQRGQGLTEYAVLVSLVGVACIAAMALFGGALRGRIASLVAAVAGEDAAVVEEGNAIAKKASEKVRSRAKVVDGMKVSTDTSSGEIIETENLQ